MSSKLFVISGPSGVGKDTLIEQVMMRLDGLFLSVSCTTRAPRGEEKHGKEYFFIDKKEFEEGIQNDGFLEYAEYCGVYYGTPKKPVDDALDAGKSVILEIECDGMEKIVAKRPDAVTVFIMPPDFETLERRIRNRKTDSEQAIEKRLKKAHEEILKSDRYDYRIVNGELDRAVEELTNLIKNKTEEQG